MKLKRWLILLPFILGGCQTIKLSQTQPETIPQFEIPQQHIKVALVLGGGGSRGLAHLGVFKGAKRGRIRPDLIIGCSSGAMIGAFYADQPDAQGLEQLLIGLKRSDLMDISLFASKFGVVKGVLLKSFLEKNLKAKKFHHLHIPFIAVATDLKTGELIEFGGGEIIPPIMASTAIPGIFNPVFYKGRYLVDGGVVDPIPVRVAKKYGAQIIIAVDVGRTLSDKEPGHFFGVAQRSLEISYKHFSEYATRDADIVIRMNFERLGIFSDSYNQEIYEHGRKMAQAMLPRIKQLILDKTSAIHNSWPES